MKRPDFLSASKLAEVLKPHHFDAGSVADTIQRALASAGLMAPVAPKAASAPPDDAVIDVVAREVGSDAPGRFDTHSYSNHAGTRQYKLYVPSRLAPEPALLVMLHGCTQDPDDFAAGTRMNQLAEQHGFLALYPAQASNANGSNCWNWFKAGDQARESGEPAILAGLTREVAARHRVGPRRVFAAGLSAGAAMAVILGETHPELYAGVAAHSGLPYGAAQDVGSAFAAMSSGAGTARDLTQAVPTIVFHGDVDRTVHVANGDAIVEQALARAAAQSGRRELGFTLQEGMASGRRYERRVHADAAGRPRVEHWRIEGAGHAWSGGDTRGSFTDAKGPDASAEMLRFFLAQQ